MRPVNRVVAATVMRNGIEMSDDTNPNAGPNATPPPGEGQKPGSGPGGQSNVPQPDLTQAAATDDAKQAEENLSELADALLNDPLLAAEAATAHLEAEVAELKDQLTRSHADIQNLRRRHEKELEDMGKYAVRKFAQDIVGIADNFARAKEAVKPEDAENNASVKGLLEGVTMMDREFLNVLEKHGVKRIDSEGQPFNPHKHQAMMEQDDPSKPSGTVLQVFQAGYEIAEQVLRPAMVIVSKGGPKMPKPEAEKPAPKRPTLKIPGYDDDDLDDDEDDGAPPPIDQM